VKLKGAVAVVVVPGCAGLARRLVDEGATVVVTGTDGDEAGRLLGSRAEGPGRIAYFHGDVESDDDVDALVEFIAEQFK
jgi:NAD(P)-dependent dehydrogenase (short-subunit alcohol dehydrogenase family)